MDDHDRRRETTSSTRKMKECYLREAWKKYYSRMKRRHRHAKNQASNNNQQQAAIDNDNMEKKLHEALRDRENQDNRKRKAKKNGCVQETRDDLSPKRSNKHKIHDYNCIRAIIINHAPRRKHHHHPPRNTTVVEQSPSLISPAPDLISGEATRSGPIYGSKPQKASIFDVYCNNDSVERRSSSSPPTARIVSNGPQMAATVRRATSSTHYNYNEGEAAAAVDKSFSASRRNYVGGAAPTLLRTSSRKPPVVEKLLPCSLEDLCNGCVKEMVVNRDFLNTCTGQIIQKEVVLRVEVRPGSNRQTQIKFKGECNEKTGEYPSDVVFTVNEKPHPCFRRKDDNSDDLEMEVVVPLADALTGHLLTIPLLRKVDHKMMSLEIDEIIHPGFQKIIVGQGMPSAKHPNSRGNLIIKFLVDFPKDLTLEQRSEISSILND
ncbi:hypothetical protein Ancab_037342 [Ancistrocladus abbreviatus]